MLRSIELSAQLGWNTLVTLVWRADSPLSVCRREILSRRLTLRPRKSPWQFSRTAAAKGKGFVHCRELHSRNDDLVGVLAAVIRLSDPAFSQEYVQ
jgi:hypothetical protein